MCEFTGYIVPQTEEISKCLTPIISDFSKLSLFSPKIPLKQVKNGLLKPFLGYFDPKMFHMKHSPKFFGKNCVSRETFNAKICCLR